MNLYSVYFREDGKDKFALHTNKRKTLQFAREKNGLVKVYPGPKYNWRGSWDAPTLSAVSDVVKDFRLKEFEFVWSPEGRVITSYFTQTKKEAIALFRLAYPNYAKYKGEYYINERGIVK